MEKKLMQKDVTPAVKSSVRAYLLARCYAEVMREKVNTVYCEALEIIPLYEDRAQLRDPSRQKPKTRIYDVKQMYLSTDEETCKEVYEDVNFHLKKKGIKPAEMPEDQCPACVAEHLQTKTEWLIIDSAAEMLGEKGDFQNRLLCAGIDKYHKFIDLVVGLVVNLPDFKNPLTK